MTSPADVPAEHGPGVCWTDAILRPELFFPEGARRLGGATLFGLILLVGAAGAIDRMDSMTLSSAFSGNDLRVAGSWLAHWQIVPVGALVVGPIGYFVGGWWYWVRLRWSGARDADARLARRVYLLTMSIMAVASIGITLLDTWIFRDPMQAWRASNLQMTAIVTPFVAIYVSYRAVLASFPVQRARARFWFAIAPAVLYAVAMVGGALLAAGLLGGGA